LTIPGAACQRNVNRPHLAVGFLDWVPKAIGRKAVKTLPSLVVACRVLIYTSLMRASEALLAYLRRLD
jgi:hypothetical protein